MLASASSGQAYTAEVGAKDKGEIHSSIHHLEKVVADLVGRVTTWEDKLVN
jgi:hypothetical protein